MSDNNDPKFQNLASPDSNEQGARVPPELHKPSALSSFDMLRRRFIAGLLTIIPAGITVWAVIILVGLIEKVFGPVVKPPLRQMVELLGWSPALVAPIGKFLSLFVAVLFITAVGILTRFLFFRRLVKLGEQLVTKIPFVRFFYLTPKEVIRTITSKRDSVKRVVLVEYPRTGSWALAFATGEITMQPGDRPMVTVFMPTTPNPTTGFLMVVPRSEVLDVNLNVEDGARLIISGGIIGPNTIHTVPFAGLASRPDLPPSEPLVTHTQPELIEQAARLAQQKEDEEWDAL